MQTIAKEDMIMPRVKLGVRRQITIPAETVRRLGLQPGEELELVDNGRMITVVPRKHISKDQHWYYTEEWQKGMQEAFDDLRHGRVRGPFENVEELIKELNS
jgi:AbrB family looped-hinge helix DNA binding protein